MQQNRKKNHSSKIIVDQYDHLIKHNKINPNYQSFMQAPLSKQFNKYDSKNNNAHEESSESQYSINYPKQNQEIKYCFKCGEGFPLRIYQSHFKICQKSTKYSQKDKNCQNFDKKDQYHLYSMNQKPQSQSNFLNVRDPTNKKQQFKCLESEKNLKEKDLKKSSSKKSLSNQSKNTIKRPNSSTRKQIDLKGHQNLKDKILQKLQSARKHNIPLKLEQKNRVSSQLKKHIESSSRPKSIKKTQNKKIIQSLSGQYNTLLNTSKIQPHNDYLECNKSDLFTNGKNKKQKPDFISKLNLKQQKKQTLKKKNINFNTIMSNNGSYLNERKQKQKQTQKQRQSQKQRKAQKQKKTQKQKQKLRQKSKPQKQKLRLNQRQLKNQQNSQNFRKEQLMHNPFFVAQKKSSQIRNQTQKQLYKQQLRKQGMFRRESQSATKRRNKNTQKQLEQKPSFVDRQVKAEYYNYQRQKPSFETLRKKQQQPQRKNLVTDHHHQQRKVTRKVQHPQNQYHHRRTSSNRSHHAQDKRTKITHHQERQQQIRNVQRRQGYVRSQRENQNRQRPLNPMGQQRTNNRRRQQINHDRNRNRGQQGSNQGAFIREQPRHRGSSRPRQPLPNQRRNVTRGQNRQSRPHPIRHQTLNFISNTLNQQFDVMNQHFNLLNNIFSNFSNYVNVNISTGNAEPTTFVFGNRRRNRNQSNQYQDNSQFTSSDQSDSFDDDTDYQEDQYIYDQQEDVHPGMTEYQIQSIPIIKYSKHKHGQNQCTICLADLNQNQYFKKLYCQHVFHQECIDEWLKRKNACPVCRDQMGVRH